MEILRKIDFFQKEVNVLRPFNGEMLGQIKDYYRVRLTWTSNALEGNSLTESETKVLLEDGLTVGGKPLRDVFETVDHAKAYDFMFSLFKDRRIDEQAALRMHELFYRNIEPGYAGQYRDVPVLITGSQYPVAAPEKIQVEMDRLFEWAQKEREEYHPVEFAAQLHKRFVFIHPFKDGNGKVARLLMNLALIQDGYLPAIVPPILRMDYVSLLERAHRDDGGFMEFIAKREFESQKEILRLFQVPFPRSNAMTMLENTISMIKVMPEADLAEVQNFVRKLLQRRDAGCPFPLKSREDIYKDLEVSRQQIQNGEYQEAGEFIAEVRKEYGI